MKLENPPAQHFLTPPLRRNPSEFLDETYPAKTRETGLLYGENCLILTSTVFWLIHPCDERTDGIAIAYSALSIMLSRVKLNIKTRLTFRLCRRYCRRHCHNTGHDHSDHCILHFWRNAAKTKRCQVDIRDLRSFEIRFEFESVVRFDSIRKWLADSNRIGRACSFAGCKLSQMTQTINSASGTVYRLASSISDHTPVV